MLIGCRARFYQVLQNIIKGSPRWSRVETAFPLRMNLHEAPQFSLSQSAPACLRSLSALLALENLLSAELYIFYRLLGTNASAFRPLLRERSKCNLFKNLVCRQGLNLVSFACLLYAISCLLLTALSSCCLFAVSIGCPLSNDLPAAKNDGARYKICFQSMCSS